MAPLLKRLLLLTITCFIHLESVNASIGSILTEELSSYSSNWTFGFDFNYSQSTGNTSAPELALIFSVSQFDYQDENFFVYYSPLPLGFGWKNEGHFGPSISIWSLGFESTNQGFYPSFNYRSSGYLYRDSFYSLKALVHYALLTPWQEFNLGIKAKLLLRSNLVISKGTSIDWDLEGQVADNWVSEIFGYPPRIVTYQPFIQNFNFASRMGPKFEFDSPFALRITADLFYVDQRRFEYGAGLQFIYVNL